MPLVYTGGLGAWPHPREAGGSRKHSSGLSPGRRSGGDGAWPGSRVHEVSAEPPGSGGQDSFSVSARSLEEGSAPCLPPTLPPCVLKNLRHFQPSSDPGWLSETLAARPSFPALIPSG